MFMDSFNLALYTQITLTVAFGANHTDRWLVYQIHIGIELSGYTVGLSVATGVFVENNGF